MNISKGYKLVPVETLKFALGLTRHGFKNRTDQEADKYAALKTITELLDSSTPTQPIYDDSSIRGWEVGSRLFRQRLEAHKYITSGQSYVDGNGSKLEPLYRAKAGGGR